MVPFFQNYGFSVYLFPLIFSIESASYGIKQHTIKFSIFNLNLRFIISWGIPKMQISPRTSEEGAQNSREQ
tara:strand:+ start:627 stop:839 length:213 start_codon:yes stop_codon:yes gene_type:complete